jgi:hypothetical protein
VRCDGFAGRRVHVFCDASDGDAVAPAAEQTAALARAWCRRHGARLVARSVHTGLRNVTDGISELVEAEGAAISLEEDHLPAPGFLGFVDAALTRFSAHDEVFAVAAYRPGTPLAAAPDTFFLPVPMPVGWATWRRAWHHFSWECPDAGNVLGDPVRRHAFDLDGSYPAAALLERALAGEFESYFVRWYLAVFLAGGSVLCTRDALVLNVGLDSGLHGRPTARSSGFHNGAWNPAFRPARWQLPQGTAIDAAVYAEICAALRERTPVRPLKTKTSTS